MEDPNTTPTLLYYIYGINRVTHEGFSDPLPPGLPPCRINETGTRSRYCTSGDDLVHAMCKNRQGGSDGVIIIHQGKKNGSSTSVSLGDE